MTLLFTGLSGHAHGYFDSWDDSGNLHYYGQGQQGDMELTRGNLAIAEHESEGRRLLVFQALGKGLQVRFLGEFRHDFHYTTEAPDRDGNVRQALVFVLQPITTDQFGQLAPERESQAIDITWADDGPTTRLQLINARMKQGIFRNRLATIEAGCRLTRVADLRFLRASHIKPWAVSDERERVSRDNGLLLTPTADLLFDRGWISFRDNGQLLVAESLPKLVQERIGLDLTPGRDCGKFSREQAQFLDYHRDCVFEQDGGAGQSQVQPALF